MIPDLEKSMNKVVLMDKIRDQMHMESQFFRPSLLILTDCFDSISNRLCDKSPVLFWNCSVTQLIATQQYTYSNLEILLLWLLRLKSKQILFPLNHLETGIHFFYRTYYEINS